VLGGTFGVVSGTFSFALSLFGVVFVSAYMLIDVRRFKTAYLLAFPAHYRRDARDLWNAFGLTLSRYLNGLALDLAIQGAISAVALYLIGVPYALVLGAFVSLTALIPYIGAWLGAIPAVIVAFTVSPTAVILTVIVFVVIQQLEGNFLMPKIQGQSLNVHPVLVFLAVIIGGGLAGLVGVLLAVPTLAVLRVLFDFFRARLRTRE
jgi:predicted PurR-regulated permease PerM